MANHSRRTTSEADLWPSCACTHMCMLYTHAHTHTHACAQERERDRDREIEREAVVILQVMHPREQSKLKPGLRQQQYKV